MSGPLPRETSEVVPRYVRKDIQKVAMTVPLPISLGALRPNRGTIIWTRQSPNVLGRHLLAGGGTPDPGDAIFAAPEVGESHGPRRVFLLHCPLSGPPGI